LVLDFWATWCRPCQAKLPPMKKLYETFSGKGVCFLGIPLEDRRSMHLEKLTAWCRDQGVTWPQFCAGKGCRHPLAKALHINSVPRLIFINAQGQVAGEGRADLAERWLLKELGQ